jgi:dihydrodipicolinate synthase/N-acetylneuraminate lyase
MTGDSVRQRLRGVMVPLVTPFRASLEIDWPAFDAHVARMLDAGFGVLVPGDLVGESWALEMDEKIALIERTVRLAAGKAAVVAKISVPFLPAAGRMVRAALVAGAHAVKIALPAAETAHDALLEYVDAAGPKSGLPFLLETNGADIPLAVLDRLAEHPGLVGIEETSRDLDRFALLVERYASRLAVICGSEDVLGFTLLLGATGFMTATPNLAPSFMRALWEAGAAADAPGTLEPFRRLRRYRRLFEAELRAGHPMFVTYTKAALELAGHAVGPPRPPLRRLTDAERATLGAVVSRELGVPLASA